MSELTKEQAAAKVLALRQELQKNSYLYYVQDMPTINGRRVRRYDAPAPGTGSPVPGTGDPGFSHQKVGGRVKNGFYGSKAHYAPAEPGQRLFPGRNGGV